MTTTTNNTTEEMYEISVPVYVSINVLRNPGMSKDDVIKSVEWDEIADWDNEYISASIEDTLKSNNKDVEVFDEDGVEVK